MERNIPGRLGSPPTHQKGRGERPQGRQDESQTAPAIDVAPIRFGEKIDPRLYSDIAQTAAKAVGDKAEQKNKPTQLRRFYDELVMLQERVGSAGDRFEQQKPFIQMLKAKVAYAKGRNKVDENFETLLRKVIDEVKDPGTLKQAKLFMEAFMAFYKVHGPKD